MNTPSLSWYAMPCWTLWGDFIFTSDKDSWKRFGAMGLYLGQRVSADQHFFRSSWCEFLLKHKKGNIPVNSVLKVNWQTKCEAKAGRKCFDAQSPWGKNTLKTKFPIVCSLKLLPCLFYYLLNNVNILELTDVIPEIHKCSTINISSTIVTGISFSVYNFCLASEPILLLILCQ